MLKAWRESSYGEAFLRMALMPGDKHYDKPVRELTVAGGKMEGKN